MMGIEMDSGTEKALAKEAVETMACSNQVASKSDLSDAISTMTWRMSAMFVAFTGIVVALAKLI